MTPEEAIKLFEEDLEHTRQHLQDKEEYKEQNPEFYEELKRWEQAEELAIKALHSISKPTGEWIRSEETFEDLSGTFETYTRSTCSVCNQANGWGEVPYCPWCGTKMEENT